MRINLKKITVLCALLAGTFLVSACDKYTAQTSKKIETALERAEDYRQRAQIPDLPEPVDTVRTKNDIWLGTDSVKITEGDTLPAWLESEDSITIAIAEEATLPQITQELTEMTGIAVRLDDLKLSEAVPENTVPVNYTGKLSGFLDYLANRFGVWWRYKNGIVSFFNTETRIFNIYALPTETTISTSISGTAVGTSGGGAPSSQLSSQANLALWDSIEEGVTQIVGESNGSLSFSRVAGTVTVTASPFIVRKVGNYVDTWNQKLSRQVAISIKLLQVTIDNEDNYGLNLNAVFNSSDIAATFTGPYSLVSGGTAGATTGLLSMTLIKPDSKWNGSEAFIQAFSTLGKASLVTSASVTTLNNKAAPIQITTEENYVRETRVTKSNDSDDNTTDVDMDTDTLTYGFMMEVLPRILDHGRLILMFSMNLSDLLALETFSSDGSSGGGSSNDEDDDENNNNDGERDTTVVQLPKIQTRGFLQEIAMRSGSTLVLTGFERVQNMTNTAGIGKAKMGLLGGQSYSKNTRDVLVILLTPEVLESPLSPESRMRDY